jgi:SAM-dependent methyltransferase
MQLLERTTRRLRRLRFRSRRFWAARKFPAEAADRETWSSWYAGKEFSSDWVSLHLPIWTRILARFRESDADVLEIGSWEGRSAVFFCEFLPRCRVTCVDTFGGGAEHHLNPKESRELPFIECRFDANLRAYEGRVTKLKSPSVAALDQLGQAGTGFDIIYVDGSHLRDDVMIDTLLAWRILRPGGVLLWDDYGNFDGRLDKEGVYPAVNAFLRWHAGDLTLLHRGYQVIVQRNR